jgi:cytochrome oxidase Cu insertion factor (SCO1/SenC/PrrC family)
MNRTLRRAGTPAVDTWLLVAAAVVLAALLIALVLTVIFRPSSPSGPSSTSPNGWAIPLGGHPAPGFSLLDQWGHRRTLSSYRGRPVVLAFVDAQCTTVCPLTAQILRTAQLRLGTRESGRVRVVAINANPLATSVKDVYRWSVQHHMLHHWTFLTGPPPRLRAVYHKYRVFDAVIDHGQVTHDAAVIMIDAHGRERLYFNTAGTKYRPTVLSEEAAYAAGMRAILR